jgi:hypothetical protein
MKQQRPTTAGNLSEWDRFRASPRERRVLAVSEYETIFGEAPSGAHESEERWLIWKEITDETGKVTVEYAQGGRNDLRWIHASISFIPQANGPYPYFIELDNYNVFDGMAAGLPVANITVYDSDSGSHVLDLYEDIGDQFFISGGVLFLNKPVQIIDVAYPIKIRATDPDGNQYIQPIAIYIQEFPPVPGSFIGELNVFVEDSVLPTAVSTIISYQVPASRRLRLRFIEVFGKNKANFSVLVDGDLVAKKGTYYTHYSDNFDFQNFLVEPGQTLTVLAENLGGVATYFNARMRGYQYAI